MPGKERSCLPYDLENMSIPALEALLQRDFIAPDDDTPDVELIMAIMEVIQRKEREAAEHPSLDTKQAWEDFQTCYNTKEYRDHSLYGGDHDDRDHSPTKAPRRRKHRAPILAAAVVMLVVFLTCIPVFGYTSVLQMVAKLSYEHFQFVPAPPDPNTGNISADPTDTYHTMPEALAAYGIDTPVFPKALAENYTQTDLQVTEVALSPKVHFNAVYEEDGRQIIFSITRYTTPSSGVYEKNAGEVPEVYHLNGTEYYIFQNIDRTIIAWYSGLLECSIKGDFSPEDAEALIDSIY